MEDRVTFGGLSFITERAALCQYDAGFSVAAVDDSWW
jgi:hypothetical protein